MIASSEINPLVLFYDKPAQKQMRSSQISDRNYHYHFLLLLHYIGLDVQNSLIPYEIEENADD
mgnify:CR=1 FL=1